MPAVLPFEDLHIVGADHFAVDVGQHPGHLGVGVLQHGVHAADLVAGALAVMPGHDGFQHIAPVHRAFVIVGVGLWQSSVTSGLLQPQFQLRLVGVEANGGCGIRAADAAFAHLQPLFSWQFLGTDQAQG